MEQQTVKVKFWGERIGTLTDENTTYTLYGVSDDLYVVHVDEGDESWLETNGGQGLSEEMLGTFFPQLGEAFVSSDQAHPHKFRPASPRGSSPSWQGHLRSPRRTARQAAMSSSAS